MGLGHYDQRVRALSDELVLNAVRTQVDVDAALALARSGSLQAGLGTPASDIDVYALCTSVPSGVSVDVQIHVAETRIDVEWIPVSDIRGLLATLSAEIASSRPIARRNELFDSAARLATATCLYGDLAVIGALVASARQALADARVPWSNELLTGIHNGFEDLLGFIACGDVVSVSVLRDRLVLQALDALCILAESYYRGEKWIIRRSRSMWPRTVERLAFGEDQSRHGAGAIVGPVQVLTGVGALAIHTSESALIRNADEAIASMLSRQQHPSGPTRSPLFFPSANAGQVVINRADREAYSLDTVEVACFVAATGAVASEVTSDARMLLSVFGEDVTEREIYLGLHRLASRGLIDSLAKWEPLLIDPEMHAYFRQLHQ